LPSDFVGSVVFAVTGSPGLFFLASTGCESVAFIAVPLERAGELCPALADVEPELLLAADAPDLSVCTEALLLADELACAPPCAYAPEPDITSMPPRMTTEVAFINGPPPNKRLTPQYMDELGFHFPLRGISGGAIS
jgi:hypothetical protein